jgi:hypothetical protein
MNTLNQKLTTKSVTTNWPHDLVERLEHHMNDKRNTAFARSTMREVYNLIGKIPAQPSAQEEHDVLLALAKEIYGKVCAPFSNLSTAPADCIKVLLEKANANAAALDIHTIVDRYVTQPPIVAASHDALMQVADRVRREAISISNAYKPDGDMAKLRQKLIDLDFAAIAEEVRAEFSSPAVAVPDGCLEFISDVVRQVPEKPDYWNECSQCSRNIDRAEDLLAVAQKGGE